METNKRIENKEINIIKRAVVEQIEELYNKLILKKFNKKLSECTAPKILDKFFMDIENDKFLIR